MEDQAKQAQCNWKGTTAYVVTRSIVAIAVIVAVLWGLTHIVRRIEWPAYAPPRVAGSQPEVVGETPAPEGMERQPSGDVHAEMHLSDAVPDSQSLDLPHAEEGPQPLPSEPDLSEVAEVGQETKPAAELPSAPVQVGQAEGMAAEAVAPSDHTEPVAPAAPEKSIGNLLPAPEATGTTTMTTQDTVESPAGIALVEAVIEPLAYELNDRFWGWRPNDMLNITDNVNNFQLGVLEVTRRAIAQLAQHASSPEGSDPNLRNAMDLIMTKATKRWFPSAESKYKESLEALKAYKTDLESGKAHFYTRPDDLILLLATFEDLLDSCDQDLVKDTESDGTAVSTFKADDYFYYTRGVAHAMAAILDGAQTDFAPVMENRRSAELLQHAIEACQRAAQIDPWIVTNAGLDGILANHRANMAAPIGHARYYLGQLVVVLST